MLSHWMKSLCDSVSSHSASLSPSRHYSSQLFCVYLCYIDLRGGLHLVRCKCLTMQPWLACNSLGSSSWPPTHRSAFRVLGPKFNSHDIVTLFGKMNSLASDVLLKLNEVVCAYDLRVWEAEAGGLSSPAWAI